MPVRPILSILVLVAALVAPVACTVGPDYAPPKTAVPAAFEIPRTADAARTSELTGQPADVSRWWASFNDPVLTSLIERGVASNLDLKAAGSRVRQARASRAITAGGQWPQVNSSASATQSRRPTVVNGQTQGITSDLYQAGLDASWEVDVFGGVRRAVEAADAGVVSAEEDRRNVMVTVASEVALNYADLRGLQEQLRVARENLAAQEKTLDITQRKLAAGLDTTRLDVVNAQAQVASTRAGIPSVEAAIRQAIYNLGVLLGLEPTALEQELLTAAPIPSVPPTVPAGLPSDLLERRPDIRRAVAQVHVTTAQIGVAKSDLFPRFSLTGSLGFASDQLSKVVSWDRRSTSIGAGVSWPIFAGGSIRANVALSEERREETLIVLQQTVLNALLEVQVALESYAREQERRAALITAVDSNRRAVEMATRLYAEGQTEFLNVLSAQRSLLGAEQSLAQSTATLTTDLIALYKALGGGWEDRDTEPGAPRPN